MTHSDASINSLISNPLGDRFHVLKLLGQGNFGRTFLAVDESQLEKPRCAIKQFFPQGLDSTNGGAAADLFRQEAERLRQLFFTSRRVNGVILDRIASLPALGLEIDRVWSQ